MKFIVLFRRRDRPGSPIEAAAVQADSAEAAMDPYGRFKRCSMLYAATEPETGDLIRQLQEGLTGAAYPLRSRIATEQLRDIVVDPRASNEDVLEAFLNTEVWKEEDIAKTVALIREERPDVYASIEAYAVESVRPMGMDKYGVVTEKKATCPICGSDLNTETNPPTCPKCGTRGIEKASEEHIVETVEDLPPQFRGEK